MKRQLIFTALAFALYVWVPAQQKELTIVDASYLNRDLFVEYLSNLTWRGASEQFTYVAGNALIAGKGSDKTIDTLLKLDELNIHMKKLGKEDMKRFPRISWLDEDRFMFRHDNAVFTFLMEKDSLREENRYDEGAGNIFVEPERFRVAYTIDNNLYMADEGTQIQVTFNEAPSVISGQTVHRVEFGIDRGIFWSPGGDKLAFYHKDESMVTDYPLVDVGQRTGKARNIKYPMAGMTSEEVKLGIYDPGSREIIYLDTGEPADQYITAVTWGPAGKYIYAGILNRGQDTLRVNQYDAMTGALVKNLFEEIHQKYVEPEHPLFFLNDDPEHFVWMSERDGYQHLYLYHTDGELIRQLTSGEWVVTDYHGTDPGNKQAFFTATKESPLNRDIYSVELKNGRIRPLFSHPGTHTVQMNSNGDLFIDMFRDTATVAEYSVVRTNGKETGAFFKADNPLGEYNLGKLSVFTIDADDGTELYCRMILPPGFDPSVKYPVINYVYGGPHAQLITNTPRAGASLFLDYLAQEGYIIWTLDNRGSANRGRDFEQAIFRRLGGVEVSDQYAGIEYLKSLPYVDEERIGVNGWSYGGFMTINLMLQHPETFKVGVCGGPVTDWQYYEVMYGERYMDTPEENPEGYEGSSLIKKADRLQGDLLIIHGTHDPTVVWQQSLALLQRFIEEGKDVDYFVYPGHGHGVGGKDRLHLNRKMARYFREHLYGR